MLNLKKVSTKKFFRTGAVALALTTGVAATGASVANAATVTEAATTTTSNPKITDIHSQNKIINTSYKNLTLYSDPAGTSKTGKVLSTTVQYWKAQKVARDSNNNIIAYDLGNNQWVKVSDLQSTKTTANSSLTIKTLPSDAVLNSHYKAVAVYKDAATTQKVDTLSTYTTSWKAFKEAVNANGQVVSVEIGTNQWVKISDGVTLEE